MGYDWCAFAVFLAAMYVLDRVYSRRGSVAITPIADTEGRSGLDSCLPEAEVQYAAERATGMHEYQSRKSGQS
jgi:hypothetical protein